jgi:poly-beta-hydroxyalkanoate depolymerase
LLISSVRNTTKATTPKSVSNMGAPCSNATSPSARNRRALPAPITWLSDQDIDVRIVNGLRLGPHGTG